MTRLRLRDFFSAPGLVTLARAPLAAVFPFTVDRPRVAFAILVVAGLSDVLDGWYARRSGKATATGAILDPVMDKLFVTTVVVTLLLTSHLPGRAALLLLTRELVQLPLAAWLAFDRRNVSNRSSRLRANWFGKVCTVLQFGTIAAALVAVRYLNLLALASAIAGIAAGVSYWATLLPRDGTPRRNGPKRLARA